MPVSSTVTGVLLCTCGGMRPYVSTIGWCARWMLFRMIASFGHTASCTSWRVLRGHDQARLAKASQANSLITVHSFIPVVVGFRHSDLASKIAGMMFALALESRDLDDLNRKLDNVVS
eukprot:1304337-Alexandrium_andersonii.AAC.1